MNTITLVGNLGFDAELKFSQGGMAILRMRIATSRYKKDGNVTDWHTVKVFGKHAESLGGLNLTKGTKVGVVGKLTYNEWEKDGAKRRDAEILADDVELLGGKRQKPQGTDSTGDFAGAAADEFGEDSIPFQGIDERLS